MRISTAEHVVVVYSAHLPLAVLDHWMNGFISENRERPKMDMLAIYQTLRELHDCTPAGYLVLQMLEACLRVHPKVTEVHLLQHENRSVSAHVISAIQGVGRNLLSGKRRLGVFVHEVVERRTRIDYVLLACVDPRIGSMAQNFSNAGTDNASDIARIIRLPGPDGIMCKKGRNRETVLENITKMVEGMHCEHSPVIVVGHEECGARKLRSSRSLIAPRDDVAIMKRETDASNAWLNACGFAQERGSNTSSSLFLLKKGGFKNFSANV